MQQQGLAVQIPVGIDGIFQQECRRAGGNEALRKKFMNGQPSQGPEPTTMDKSASGGASWARKKWFRCGYRFLLAPARRRQARQQHFIGEERRDIEPDDGAPIAHLKLLGDRLQLREDIVDVLEIMGARVRHVRVRTPRSNSATPSCSSRALI